MHDNDDRRDQGTAVNQTESKTDNTRDNPKNHVDRCAECPLVVRVLHPPWRVLVLQIVGVLGVEEHRSEDGCQSAINGGFDNGIKLR